MEELFWYYAGEDGTINVNEFGQFVADMGEPVDMSDPDTAKYV